MKRLVVVAMSLAALMFGAVRSAQAGTVLNFAPPAKEAIHSNREELPSYRDRSKSEPKQISADDQKDSSSQVVVPVKQTTALPSTSRSDSARRVAKRVAVTFQPSSRRDVINSNAFDSSNASRSEPLTSEPPILIGADAIAPAPHPALFLSADQLFEGGSDSLVATAVGSAEGTRTPNGGKTWAYYGHVDPGNAQWNLGSFSYQHGARSPEEADERQLNRLRRQFEIIRQTAELSGLKLSLEEQLNAIDLANQAPLAALASGGYIERLRQAYTEGFQGTDAVLRARTYSYINPATRRWDAPGLGNTEYSISRDQARRLSAIAQALSLHPSTRALESVAEKQNSTSKPDSRVSRLP
ncbi:MAG: hypothetical protein KME13_02930 [Myxacorys californica WJT36-NPBG1]|jgi:hypothetical protein|nr:hypothetical protein [Myxacorys californica WJT36-NPBG1]